jgi:SAM-dependent methyltransferase
MQDVRVQSVLKGGGSFLLPFLRTTHRDEGTSEAAHCYALFLRHYSYLRRISPAVPKVVAEFGPGSSLGTGLAALLAGAEKYIALDLQAHRTCIHDLKVLNDLIDLFSRRTPAPVDGRHAQTFPMPRDYHFPPELESTLATSLAPQRLQHLRADLAEQRGDMVQYIAPWTDPQCLAPCTVDWLFSHSVLEHVDDLASAYSAMERWLRPTCLTTHLIDFFSHGLTREWNGHWALRGRLWHVIRGKRPYLLNRTWRSQHLALFRAHGFTILEEVIERRSDGLVPHSFAPEFRNIPDEDARTRMMFVLARKEHTIVDQIERPDVGEDLAYA